jgi:hypothetical protein
VHNQPSGEAYTKKFKAVTLSLKRSFVNWDLRAGKLWPYIANAPFLSSIKGIQKHHQPPSKLKLASSKCSCSYLYVRFLFSACLIAQVVFTYLLVLSLISGQRFFSPGGHIFGSSSQD